MYYVFGAKEEDGNLRYYIDAEGISIFRFATVEDAKEALSIHYGMNPDFELFKLLPESAALCEC